LLVSIPIIDVGVAVILLTIIVKLILFPLSKKAVRTQALMRTIQPKLEEIKKKYKNDSQKQAQETMQLYKKEGVNPFSGIFLIILQLPVIFGLYFIFLRAGLPEINTDILYSFVNVPQSINMSFLGFLDITERSVIFALITGITQYIQISLMTPKTDTKKKKSGGFAENFAQSMQFQMRYMMPVIVTVIAYTLPSMIALYWITSNVFTIGQEFVVRRSTKKESVLVTE